MVISQQCEDYRAFYLRNRMSREPFPATVQDLLAYIRYRGRVRTFVKYLVNLDQHPLHGKEWFQKMNNDPKIISEMDLLTRLWNIPVSKHPSLIGASGNANKPVVNKASTTTQETKLYRIEDTRSTFRGFMLSSTPPKPVLDNVATPTSIPKPKSVPKSTSLSIPEKTPTKSPSKSSVISPNESSSKPSSKPPNKLSDGSPINILDEAPSQSSSKASSSVFKQNNISTSNIPKFNLDNASELTIAPKPSKSKRRKWEPPETRLFAKRKYDLNLLKKDEKKRNITSEYIEPYILIESLDPAHPSNIDPARPSNIDPAHPSNISNSNEEVDSLEVGDGWRNLDLYESEEEKELEKTEEKQEPEMVQYEKEEVVNEEKENDFFVMDEYSKAELTIDNEEDEEYEGGYRGEPEGEIEDWFGEDYGEDYERLACEELLHAEEAFKKRAFEEEVRQREVLLEELRKEEIHKEEIRKEEIRKEEIRQREVLLEELSKEEENDDNERYEEYEKYEENDDEDCQEGDYFDMKAYNDYIEDKRKKEELEELTNIRVNEPTLYIFSHIEIEKSFR